MPSARASNFAGGGGILRRKDGTIVDIQFTTENPLFKDQNEPKEGAFTWLYAVLTIQEDGRDQLTKQPLKVGDVKDFTVCCDGRGVSGTVAFGKNSQFGIFMQHLAKPKDGGAGQPEDIYPEDPDGLVADYSNIRGTRVMFDWIEDTSKWAKANPRKVTKDGVTKMYPRENLVVAQYYSQVDVSKLPAPGKASAPKSSGSRPGATGGKPTAAAKPATAGTVDPVAVAARATEEVIKAVKAAKGKPVSKTKLSVKLLTALGSDDQNLSNAVRLWASEDSNLGDIDEVVYDAAKQELTLAEVAA
jgi:hypothetical protein